MRKNMMRDPIFVLFTMINSFKKSSIKFIQAISPDFASADTPQGQSKIKIGCFVEKKY